MDTQGYDLEVFRGLGALEPRVVLLQSELSVVPIYEQMPSMLEALALYQAHGFRLAAAVPVSRDNEQGTAIELDGLLCRSSGGQT